jgi:GNAT superfamily N-acetyltransferase
LAEYPSFIEILAAWHFEAFGRLTPGDSVARRIELLQRRAIRRAIPTVIVAMLEGELAGSATLADSDMETRRDLTPWMTDVFVKPEFRRQKIASTLVRRIVEEARARRRRTLSLHHRQAARAALHGPQMVRRRPPHLPERRARADGDPP